MTEDSAKTGKKKLTFGQSFIALTGALVPALCLFYLTLNFAEAWPSEKNFSFFVEPASHEVLGVEKDFVVELSKSEESGFYSVSIEKRRTWFSWLMATGVGVVAFFWRLRDNLKNPWVATDWDLRG